MIRIEGSPLPFVPFVFMPRQILAAAMAAAALALWADILAPGSLLPVRPSGPAILQTLPD